jgi:anti-sigma B factor antagonist
MADPRYPVVLIGGASVVAAPPEIDTKNAEWFRNVLLYASSRAQATVVNMTSTQFCDSAGVSAVAWAHGHTKAKGDELLLVIPADAAVLRVFALTGLDRLIPIFSDLNDALEQAHAALPPPLQRRAMPSPDTDLAAD